MKKIIKIMTAVMVFGLLAAPVFATDYGVPEKEANKSAAGIYAMGWNSGIAGLQYQHWFDNLGFQITFGGNMEQITYSTSSKNEAYLDAYFAGSGHLLYTVFSTNQARAFYTRFYLWLMGGAIGGSNYNTPFFVDGCAGLGFGTEFVLWHRMSIPVEFGLAGNFPNDPKFSVSGAVGIRFRF